MKKIMVFTGAGVSAASGLPTYRGTGGIWTENPKLEEFMNAANIDKHWDEIWKHIYEMKSLLADTVPNDFHRLVAGLEENYDVTVVTQNVDTLHEMAGSTDVYHLHGSLAEQRCVDCNAVSDLEQDHNTPCPFCASEKTRPNVVLFGEELSAILYNQSLDIAEAADIVIAAGTTGCVFPACNLLIIANDRAFMKQTDFHYFNLNAPEVEYPFAKMHMGLLEDTFLPFVKELHDEVSIK